MQLNELREELRFYGDLLNLVETLKNIAAAQYHSMEKEKERFDDFMQAFSGFFRVVSMVDVDDPLVRVVSDVTGIVIVTSDSGFMGGLNQGVIRRAHELQGDLPDERVSLVVIGDKGVSVLSDQEREFKAFGGIDRETLYEQAVAIKDYIVGEVLARRMGKVVVVYPRPVSFTSQVIEAAGILPCAELFEVPIERQTPPRGFVGRLTSGSRGVIVESSLSDMLEYLSSVWVTAKLFEAFEDSKLAEFSARALHLEGSIDKVRTRFNKLKQQAFKAAHEQIDKGMRETFSASKSKQSRAKRSAAVAAAAAAG